MTMRGIVRKTVVANIEIVLVTVVGSSRK